MPRLTELRQSLPATWYFDPAQYERELEAVWYRDWVCVGRSEQVAQPGAYLAAAIGSQSVIVTRNGEGELRAFHNTCRHRGAALCRDEQGRFFNQRIICRYHNWTYSTDGELLATPGRIESEGFHNSRFPLYRVHVASWGGFVFVNLADAPARDLLAFLGSEADNVAHWPLASLRSVHREVKSLACNWKIFWENYSECYHCPRIHPELCRVMPAFRHAVTNPADLPGWEPAFAGDSGRPRVAEGMRTWTRDGQSALPPIAGPTTSDVEAGVAFASFTASMFIVAHPDYVRSVRLVPTGPESCRLVIDWLLPETTSIRNEDELAPILELARIVIRQDGEVCELNQRGLRSRAHDRGVLVGQEHDLWEFHEWLRERLAAS